MGKPITESRDEVGMVAEVLYFYAGAVDKHRGATVPVAGGVDMTFHEPLGVVGAIIPWNFPVAITSWKVGPALATGNTIVVKPAEITPLTAVRLAELGLEAGLPEGVLQVVTGKGSVVGTRLAEHPDVAKVAFTGSTEVGRDVMARSSGTIKRVTLELGGKSASVVFADADLAKAAAAAPGGVFANAGQDCCARSRILVQRSAMDEFLDLLADAVQAWTVGDPTDPDNKMGPLVTAAHRGVVAGFLEDGHGRRRRAGAGPHRGLRARRPRLLVPADGRGPGRSGLAHGPRGDLRTHRGRDPVRRRGRRRPPGQRHPLRAVRVDLDPRQRPVAADGPGHPGRQPVGQLQQLGAGADQLRRHEAVGIRARARPRGAGLLHRGQERLRLDGRLTPVPPLGGDGSGGPLVAVVTGAGRGIGAGLAAHFADRGIRLGLCARAETGRARRGPTPWPAAVDVTDAAAVGAFAESVVARFDRIDLWVNNAGVLDPVGPLADADPAALERHVATNVLGVMHGTAAFARHVRGRAGTGSLVNVSSGAASTPYRGWAAYCASKAAVEMLTEVVGLEEADAGLLAFAVAPGVVDTDMQARIRATPEERFPDVARFRRLLDEDAFLTPAWVGACILERCVDPATRWVPEPGRGAVHFRVPDPGPDS